MTEEELNAKIAEAVEAAVLKETTALKEKNAQLLREKSDLKTAKTQAEQDAEDAKNEAHAKAGDVEALKASLTATHAKALEALQKERDNAIRDRDDNLVTSALTRNFAANNVPAHFIEPLTAMLKAQAKVADGSVLIGDADADTYLKTYFAGDVGKNFVLAPNSGGAGATGASKVSGDQWTKPTTAQEMTDFAKLSVSDPALHATLSSRFGM